MSARSTAVLLVAGAVVVNAAFLGLVQVFDYPDVLNRPPTEVMATFAERQAPVTCCSCCWPRVPACWLRSPCDSAGWTDPPYCGPRSGSVWRPPWSRCRTAALAPAGARLAATPTTRRRSRPSPGYLVLGTLVGETVGYTLTAVWTVLVAVGLRRSHLGPVLPASASGPRS